jgi:hypothetical protein
MWEGLTSDWVSRAGGLEARVLSFSISSCAGEQEALSDGNLRGIRCEL